MTRSHIYKLYYMIISYIILHNELIMILSYCIILHYILHYITLYITLYYIIYYIILHYISYTLFYHVIWLSSQSYPTIKPFCASFGRKLRPTTNPPSQQPGNATWKTIAAVPRFSFFFESDRNRSFGRRFDTTTEIFWMLVSEVEEATTKKFLEFVFFGAKLFFWSVLLHEKNATVNKCVWRFLVGDKTLRSLAHQTFPVELYEWNLH